MDAGFCGGGVGGTRVGGDRDDGAEVNVVSKAGVTPWLAASGYGDRLGGVLYNKAGADILAKHGADPTLGKPCQAQNKCR